MGSISSKVFLEIRVKTLLEDFIDIIYQAEQVALEKGVDIVPELKELEVRVKKYYDTIKDNG